MEGWSTRESSRIFGNVLMTRPPRSTPEEIAEDVEAWKREMAERHNDPDAWKRYAGDSFAEIEEYHGTKELNRRRRLTRAGINPYTGDTLPPD